MVTRQPKGRKRKDATASSDLAVILLKYASGLGIEIESVCTKVGLDVCTLDEHASRLSVDTFNALWEEIVLRSGDRDFGLHFGEAGHAFFGGHILFSVMMNCPTVGDALEKLFRYHSLMADIHEMQITREGIYTSVRLQPLRPGVELHRHHSEAVLSIVVTMLRRLSENRIDPVEVRFAHPEPVDESEHERLFRSPLLFRQPGNQMIIREKDLAVPIFMANPDLLETLERFADDRVQDLYGLDSWADRVTRSLGEALSRGERPTVESAAQGLAVGTRQLQSRLKAEGVTYQQLLDRIREETALRYLGKPEVTICDIAFLLGFSEQSAFNHAFKRWTGKTPGEYRKTVLRNP
jgi:AraC-like DNA-binding protein